VTRKTMLITAFVFLAALQLAAPLWMISRREETLRNGKAFRFKAAPVDPYDAFRGRYVAISVDLSGNTETNRWFGRNSVAVTNAAAFERGQRVFALLEEGTNGFARVSALIPMRPRDADFIRTRVRWISDASHVALDIPFDRYYMNEAKAPEAEQAYREHSRRTNQTAYVTVRVRSGFAVLEELYVDDKPIREFLEAKTR
jgi:uncharacterized membrane-anchored protein